MAIFSNLKGIKDAKEVAGAQQMTAITAMEAVDREKARGLANEQAKMAVWGLLGQEGTYGGQNTFTADWENENNVDDPTSLFDTSGVGLSQPNQALWKMAPNDGKGKGILLGTAREGILDPTAYAKAVSNTASFRIQSQRTAESEQLLNQEGPAWDMLSNSVLGVINEGSALQLRDTMRQLKNQYAKGGTARRTAMFEANELLAGERAMRLRVQETWQANLELFSAIRTNADRVAAGNQSFMAGLPLVNDSYRDAMQKTAYMQIEASSMANNAIMSAYDTKMTQQPVNFIENHIEGTLKLAASLAVSYVSKGTADTSGSSSEGISQMFGGNPDKGYTARSGSSYSGVGGSSGGGMFDTALKAGLDYLNRPKEPSMESDSGWSIDRGPQSASNTAIADKYSLPKFSWQ